MRGLIALVVGMGVLIVVGVVALGITAMRRMTPATTAAATLDEPDGSRIAGMAGVGDRLAVWLQGGGPDRLVVVDPRNGQVVARLAIGR